MFKKLALLTVPVLLAMAPMPTNKVQACSAMDDCKTECVVQCMKNGGGFTYCLDVICAHTICP